MHALRSARPRIVRRLRASKVTAPTRSYVDTILSIWRVTVPVGVAGVSVATSYRAYRDEDECKTLAATAGFMIGLVHGAAWGFMVPFAPVAIPIVLLMDRMDQKTSE